MADLVQKGKAQSTAKEGTIRIEYDNDRIVYTQDGVVVREDAADHTSFYDPDTGGEAMRFGVLPDGKYGISWYDPTTGREFMRSGVLPDDTAGVVVPKDGYSVEDIYA